MVDGKRGFFADVACGQIGLIRVRHHNGGSGGRPGIFREGGAFLNLIDRGSIQLMPADHEISSRAFHRSERGGRVVGRSAEQILLEVAEMIAVWIGGRG